MGCLFAGASVLVVVLAAWGPDASKPPVATDVDTYLQLLRDSAKRVNGAHLSASADVKDGSIQIRWALDYNGPRPPLIIQKPIYPQYSFEATSIRVIYASPPSSKRPYCATKI